MVQIAQDGILHQVRIVEGGAFAIRVLRNSADALLDVLQQHQVGLRIGLHRTWASLSTRSRNAGCRERSVTT